MLTASTAAGDRPDRADCPLPAQEWNTPHRPVNKKHSFYCYNQFTIKGNQHVARTPIKTLKDDEKWPLFVNKQLFRWSASIPLDNNNDVLTRLFAIFLKLCFYHIPQLA